ncbi:MAG: P-loop NTPase [Rhodothermales bacterium]|nr:P-loop NTPase [Rhodothermales bacterium]
MKRTSTIIAVASGKGGVGKSIVSVNLAETLAAEGHQVALIDVDLGQGACALLLNEQPAGSVIDLVRKTTRKEQVLHRTAAGITLIMGAAEAGRTETREGRLFDALDELIHELRQDHAFIILDAPAGTEGAVRWAMDRADVGMLVLVGEPTAISDAYRLARMIWEFDPDYPMCAVVNFADSEEDATSVADRFGKVTRHFTGRATNYLGWVPFSPLIRRSVSVQEPAVRTPGPVQEAFRTMCHNLVKGRQLALEPISFN